MATITIDVAGILREIRITVGEIKNGVAAASEKKKAAQLLVYRALSLHPAVDHMRPPTGMLADVDWYTELRSTFNSGIFHRLGQNEHFKKMALLGETGTRARIMLLLLWIIGHRLSQDSVATLLSTVFGDAIRREENPDLDDELQQLVSVKEVLVSLRKMIKTKLPLSPDRNPFQGRDYSPEDEDKALPRSELWGYALPEELRYEYDVRQNPALLLRSLPVKTIIPQTKLTILLIQWAACNFGLGKKVYSAEDFDAEAWWNADPPPPVHDDEDRLSLSSLSSRNSVAFEAFEGLGITPYEAMWQDDPIEDWIHSRFCSIYPVHGWAHRSFIRVLLFNAFCGTQTLPDPDQILEAVHVADRLFRRFPVDIWQYTEKFIIACALLDWETNTANPWSRVFSEMSPEERSKMVIFVDALKWVEDPQLWSDVDHPSSLMDIREFLVDPLRTCQDAPDILSLPEISSGDTHSSLNVLPDLDPTTCICGECAFIHSQQPSNLESFRSQYFVVTSSRPSQCDALARIWEPTISAAEEWLEGLVSRVECQFALFPGVDRRMGPAALGIANAMDIVIGSQLSDQQLLRFFVALKVLTDDIPISIPKSPGPCGLGYVVSLPWATDREDYKIDDGPDRVLLANGGWLYDSISTEGVTLLHEREDFKIVYHTTILGKFFAVCMPHFRGDSVSHFPPHLSNPTPAKPVTSDVVDQGDEMELTLVLSRFQIDAFPLLSVRSETGFAAPRGALAALIRVKCLGRVIETVWKPDVKQGSPCEHTALWRQQTRSSPTAIDLILRVLPPSDASLKAADTSAFEEVFFAASQDAAARGQKLLMEMLNELSRRVEPLTVVDSPLERTRACIVRCGAKDGPVDAIVVLASSLRKNVYILDRRECWDCALIHMSENGQTVGISMETKR
ncbi:hypothetical protein B0H19DRAFT_1131557 [Mycena capillaripes]|nr:hypothetical protein B0H19DRAFT_1131557 [Mycena capillaripes]